MSKAAKKQRTIKINEDKGKKLLYFHCKNLARDQSNYIWIVLDSDRCSAEVDDEMTNSCPKYFSNRIAYGTVVLNSKIYFMGGELLSEDFTVKARGNRGFSNLVYVFDTISKQWDDGNQITPMQTPRSNLTAVPANDQSGIYVFGSFYPDLHLNSIEHWVEFYNFSTKKWIYITGTPTDAYNSFDITSHIVHGDFIYFWFFRWGVYSFNMENHVWSKLEEGESIPHHNWSHKVAIIDGVLFYHCYGNIYAYHFNTKETLFLFSMEDDLDDFSALDTFGEPWCTRPTFLVHMGAKMLCLFWQDLYNLNKFHSYKFQLTTDEDGELDIYFKGNENFLVEGCSKISKLRRVLQMGAGWPIV